MALGLHGLLAAAWIAAAPTGPGPAPEPEPSVWLARPDGSRFRVRFDPGQRLVLGAAADLRAGGRAPGRAAALELGLFLRSAPPTPGWEVAWWADQELAHLRFAPAAPGGATVAGALYRGLFIRRSRAGTVTLPLSPPVALALPFDIGLRVEVGRLDGAVAAPFAEGSSLDAGVVDGEIVADFWRSRRPGCWLLAGVGARYDTRLERDGTGVLASDHRVTPMTALSLAAHAQRGDGLLVGGGRLEAARRWSSARGWEETVRLDGEVEGIPVAVNDRPVSLFAAGSLEAGGGLPAPDLRIIVGARFWVGARFRQPLR